MARTSVVAAAVLVLVAGCGGTPDAQRRGQSAVTGIAGDLLRMHP